MTTIPRDFIDLLLEKINVVDLIHSYIPLQKKSASNYFARCPFHQEKTGSFSVSQTKQFYYCFGCGAHGNAIDFLMQHDHLPFKEAIMTLAKQAGLEIPKEIYSSKQEGLSPLFDLMEQVSKYYFKALSQSKIAIDYLKKRNISGKTAKIFQLGFAESQWHQIENHFGKNEAEKKALLDTGLIIKKEDGRTYDRFRDRIIFPIIDYRGRTIGFGGRIINQGEPKYLNSPETVLFQKGHELYGLYQALKANRKMQRMLVVEGYMDVIALFQQGITYAVATLGTATTSHHLQKLYRYTEEIIFCFDGDDAGRKAAYRALQVLLPNIHDDVQIRFLFLPDKEDPDSLIQKEGKVAFENRLMSALSLTDFFFKTLTEQVDLSTLEGRAKLATLALADIKQLSSPILQDVLLNELSKRTRIEMNMLKQQLDLKAPTLVEESKQPADFSTQKLAPSLKQAFILLIQNPKLSKLLTEPFEGTLLGLDFFKELIQIINQNNISTTGHLLEYYRDQKGEKMLKAFAKIETLIPEKGLENEMTDTLKQIKILILDELINHYLAKAAANTLLEEEKKLLHAKIAEKKQLSSYA